MLRTRMQNQENELKNSMYPVEIQLSLYHIVHPRNMENANAIIEMVHKYGPQANKEQMQEIFVITERVLKLAKYEGFFKSMIKDEIEKYT